jgi:hypothetical protein
LGPLPDRPPVVSHSDEDHSGSAPSAIEPMPRTPAPEEQGSRTDQIDDGSMARVPGVLNVLNEAYRRWLGMWLIAQEQKRSAIAKLLRRSQSIWEELNISNLLQLNSMSQKQQAQLIDAVTKEQDALPSLIAELRKDTSRCVDAYVDSLSALRQVNLRRDRAAINQDSNRYDVAMMDELIGRIEKNIREISQELEKLI